MASIWRHPASPFWAACFTVYPNATGSRPQRWKRSLKTEDRKLALKTADALEDAGRGAMTEEQIIASCGAIADSRARHAIKNVFSDVFAAVIGRPLGAGSLRAFAATWLQSIRGEVSEGTLDRYQNVVSQFLVAIGSAAERDVVTFGVRDDVLLLAFRSDLSKRLARNTANLYLKIVRQLFKAAAQRFRIQSPGTLVPGLRVRDSDANSQRQAFTLQQLGRVFREVRGTEWEGLCIAGLYTGQRLGDIAMLRWENVDLARSEIALNTRKTDRRMLIPIAEPLLEYFLSLPTPDDNPAAFVFPKAAGFISRTKAEQTVTLSNQFYEILTRAGLVRKRSHAKSPTGAGRGGRRQTSDISFHSFRHTATSLLRNAGIPQSVVMDLIGHESKAVNQVYTHVGEPELRRAVGAMPSLKVLMAAGETK